MFNENLHVEEGPNRPESPGNTAADWGDFTLLDLIILLAENKRAIFATTAMVAMLAVLVSFALPVRYTATVLLIPPQQTTSTGAALASQLGNLSGVAALAGPSLGLKNPNDMYLGLFRSRTVEDATIQRYGLQSEYKARNLSDARKFFERYSSLDGSGKDGLIRISFEDHDARRAAELANGYVEQFHKLSDHLAITEASQRRLFFEQQLQEAKKNLAAAEEALKGTQQKTGLIALDAQARALIESAASLRAQIAAKEVQIQSMRTFATSQNAQVIETQKELQSLRSQLAMLAGTQHSADGLLVPKGLISEAQLEYVRKIRNVKYYETISEILARQYELARIDEAKQGAIIQVVDPAVPPDRRSFPKRGIFVMTCTVIGFLICLIVIVLRAGFQRLKEDPESGKKLAKISRFLGPKT